MNVYSCPGCGARSNALVCLSCLDKDIQADRTAARQGSAAKSLGLPPGANPYADDPVRSGAWLDGYRGVSPHVQPGASL